MAVQRGDRRHHGAAFEPAQEVRGLVGDHLLGLRDGLAADLQVVLDDDRRGRRPSTGTRRRVRRPRARRRAARARSTMNTGACRRCLTTRSSMPLPMIGSVLAVQVTTMSNSRRRSGSSFSVIASAPKRSASLLPRSSVRLATVTDFGDFGGEVRRGELDHLAGADQQQPLLARSTGRCARRASPPRRPSRSTRCRCRSACARPWRRRTCAGTGGSARGPASPADSAERTACFIWPRICGSPSTIESRPLATRNACVTALSLRQRVDVRRQRLRRQVVEVRQPRRRPAPARRRGNRPRCDCTSTGSPLPSPAARRPGRATRPTVASGVNTTRSRTSSGAVVWLRPSV